ncbi:MAG: serine hydrolase [Planctomycetes bacterium]|nr:serine hydrolase [Planctomycetota bacterium]
MDSDALSKAVEYAKRHESSIDPTKTERLFGKRIGPVKERGDANGLIIRQGYVVAEWGDTRRVDMCFSATKSFLSTLLGLALDRKLIRDVHDTVASYVSEGYESEHNRKISWHMHAQQTSEWEGKMWGKPYDFNGSGPPREPGTRWNYNDVRINRFSLSLLWVWKKQLPRVLRSEIMDKIDASDTWQWHGYDNSTVTINDENMQSVSGGGRWGGGMWISSRDAARFGYLFLRHGIWKGERLIPDAWIKAATTPCPKKKDYGYCWWLNTNRRLWPSAPANCFAALGYGEHAIWVCPDEELVVVWRWYSGRADGLFKLVLASIKEKGN